MRYFQKRPDGVVYRAAGTELGRLYEHDPAYTEVQVVPVDAIVIRRDELPDVEVVGGSRPFARSSARPGTPPKPGYPAFPAYSTASFVGAEDALAHAEARAVEFLALREYLREHPPVDEEQVAAVRDALLSADSDDVNYIEGDDAWKLARRMVEHFGVRVEAKS